MRGTLKPDPQILKVKSLRAEHTCPQSSHCLQHPTRAKRLFQLCIKLLGPPGSAMCQEWVLGEADSEGP